MWQEIIDLICDNLVSISPPIFWSGLVFLAGLFASKWLGVISASFLEQIRLNQLLKRLGLEEALSKADIRLNAPQFFGRIVKWFFITFFLMVSLEIVGLSQFSQLLEKVLGYFPNIFVAALIFIVAAFLTDLAQKLVIGNLDKEKLTYSRFLGKALSCAIWILAVLAILYQLEIVPTLILALFVGVMAIFVLILGISFGLGGKDLAVKILKELEEKLK